MPSSLVPDISAGLRGFEFGQNIRRTRESDQQQAQDRQIALQSIQAGNIASESNAMLQFDSPELLRANLIRRAQEVTQSPVEGLRAEDFIDMANRLGDENGFSNIQAELKADLARAQEIGAATRSTLGAAGVQQAVSVPGVGFQTLTREGVAKLIELPQEDQNRIAAALEVESKRKATEAGAKKAATLKEELKTKPVIKAKEVEAKLKSEARNVGAVEAAKIASKGLDGFRTEVENSTFILQDIDRAIEIWETAPGTISGPLASRLPSLADDSQELESILAGLGIDRLSAFKGATSERELATAFRAGASMEQDSAAGLKRLKRQRAQVIRNITRLRGNISESNKAITGAGLEPKQGDQKPAVKRIIFDDQGNIIQ